MKTKRMSQQIGETWLKILEEGGDAGGTEETLKASNLMQTAIMLQSLAIMEEILSTLQAQEPPKVSELKAPPESPESLDDFMNSEFLDL